MRSIRIDAKTAEGWTTLPHSARSRLRQGKGKGPTPKSRWRPRSKYGAIPTVVDNHRFASKAEARRYAELRLLEKAGKIWDLELQPRFVLFAPSTSGYFRRAVEAQADVGLFKIGEYRADFKYWDGTTVPYVVEDVKSPVTAKLALYRWKKRHCEMQYGIEIREIQY